VNANISLSDHFSVPTLELPQPLLRRKEESIQPHKRVTGEHNCIFDKKKKKKRTEDRSGKEEEEEEQGEEEEEG
jgi:hypothetical protein